uniref:Chlorophyllase n=1 Tax=Odontella aurita TaxID=265563 RepID=A0A7S4JMH4_9STRA|mmetsp:Transcript_49005/g.147600  ORF Transcript_49005/g.147600 Transcript_49005/m.147600 type:complete len:230 (+) Transcript_49005:297-986(+)|eukprot:CAMPEP_0113532938 /NCGR_PEP_ID=MMETSP0015_2-20120614/4330_1 /TAXON_ID=2838 /ORGANISM="Odontella" /LENGTH=229 /DNA_ID=CAMNT_0000431941 /DNA_START=178 /DNA_END=867 /DNA_ORIENTATION=- /assembly_acc=CAM_ASM_000160
MTEENATIGGVKVTISRPDNPTGVTFLLPGSMIPLSEYKTTKNVLLGKNQWVLSFYINVMWPPCNNHLAQVNKVRRVFEAFREIHPQLPNCYNVVGHSVGAKVALLLRALPDNSEVLTCIALDPVDQNPAEFTNTDGAGNLSIPCADPCAVTMTLTNGGKGISMAHNAWAIHGRNPKTFLVRHEDAGHLAYTDNGGGTIARMAIPDIGSKEGNEAARNGAHQLIRKLIS